VHRYWRGELDQLASAFPAAGVSPVVVPVQDPVNPAEA